MGVNNIAMVYAPNVLRCTATDPQIMLLESQSAQKFLRTLILNLKL